MYAREGIMRDLERVKDKIEIRLEPRQVVTLGVATAVFSGVLFAAGYWVGHRQRVEPTAGSGDLARLDAARRPNRPGPGSSAPVAALGDVEFLFPSVVAAGPSRGGPEQVPVRVPAIVMQPSNTENVVAPAEPAAREEGTPGPKAGTAATPGLPPAPSPPDEDEGRVDGPVSPVTPPRVEVAPIPPPPDEDEPRPLPSLGGVVATPRSAAAPAPAPTPTPAAPKAAAPKPERAAGNAAGGSYTLQVKAVKDKAEADDFVARVRAAGLEPSVIIADVPGKGRVYRVRVGRFETMESAKRFQREFKDRTGLPEAGFVTDL
jgi:cell division septation protein DedD